MSLPLVVRPEVELDLRSARDWYDVRSEGLGDDFLAQVYRVFDRIEQTPEMYSIMWEDIRKCRLARFPYCVYYRV